MKIDLGNLKKMAQEDKQNSSSNGNNNSGYPIVYPGENGKLTIRPLFNLKLNGLQRKVIRHNSGKGKVACLQAYGEECPVCIAISNAETLKGKECGAFAKYGYKVRGICYAQILDYSSAYFRDENDPKKGDIVILMYPKTVFDQINDIIINAGDALDTLVSYNECKPIVIERTQKGKGFPEYNTYVDPYKTLKSFEDNDEKTGDEQFDELLESLPDLNEAIVPGYPTEEVRVSNKSLADIINQEYINSSVVNPGDEVDNSEDHKESNVTNVGRAIDEVKNKDVSENVSSTTSESTEVSTSDSKPECFGNRKDNDNKCMLCPVEADCFMESNG